MARVSLDLRHSIIKSKRAGWSNKKIMKHWGLSRSAVERWAKEAAKRSPNVLDLHRSGRPLKTTATQRKAIKRACTKKATASKVSRALRARGTADISRKTVARIWHMGSQPYIYAPVVPQKHLSAVNKQKRLEFCSSYKPTSHMPWAFTDGKVCSLYSGSDGRTGMAWQRVNEPLRPTPGKLIARFHFYAVVGLGLKSKLIFVSPSPKKGSSMPTDSKTFTGEDYVELMRGFKAVLGAWRPSGKYWIIRDRATQHVSAASRKAVAPMNLPILESYPPQSWDINCIEHLWAQLVGEMDGHRARSPDGFRKVILKAWGRISQTTVDKLVAGVPLRLKRIDLDGDWISPSKG